MIRLFIEGTTMLSRPLPLFAALSLCVSAAAFGQAATPEPKEGDKGDKAVTVNGKQIPKSRLDFIVKQRASQGQPDSDQTRHMIIDKDTEANDIIAQLKKGANFDDLAKQSKDPGSKDKGRDLD